MLHILDILRVLHILHMPHILDMRDILDILDVPLTKRPRDEVRALELAHAHLPQCAEAERRLSDLP
jgi:hypothetical protein